MVIQKALEFQFLEMAHPEGESLNSLFDALTDWEHQLKHTDIDFEELGL